jgi:holin-like protein
MGGGKGLETGMRGLLQPLPGVLLCIALALAGQALMAGLRLPLPGAVVGMIGYALWLASGRGIAWSRPGAQLLLRWLGAMIVPALVGLQAYMVLLANSLLPLLAVLVVTTVATGLATAFLYRWAAGRA